MKKLNFFCLLLITLFVCACDENDPNDNDHVDRSVNNILVGVYYRTYPSEEGSVARDYMQLNTDKNIFKYENIEYFVSENILQWFSEEHNGNCVYALVSGQFKDKMFTVSDMTILKESDLPEGLSFIQGQWILTQQVDDSSGSKTGYSLEDTPFWMRFNSDTLIMRNNLSDDDFVLGDIVSLSEIKIGNTKYPCFFYKRKHNYYVIKNVDENTLVISDSACDGISFTFSKMTKSPLSGTNWRLYAFCDASGEARIVNSRYNLTIGFDGATYSGKTVVNKFLGDYATEASKIRLLYGLTTLVGTADDTDHFYEERYGHAISNVSSFDYTSSELKLFYSDTEYLLFYPKVSTD